MGFFDKLANLSPEQTQGLLAFASNALQAGGSGRPVSTLGALGGGLQAYQQSIDSQRKKKLEEEQATQIAQLTGLKIKDAESDIANQQALRERAEGLRKFYMKQAPGAAQQSSGSLPASNIGGGAMKSPQGQPSPTKKSSIYEQRLAQAEALRNAGYGPEADAAEAAALKFMPQVDSWESIRVQGKIFKKPYFKDGTSGEYIPSEVAEKLMKVDTGGKTLLAGEMSGNTYQTFTNTQDPNSIASNAVSMRGQNMTDARARETIGQGRIPPGYRMQADGSMVAIPGGPADLGASKEGVQRTKDAQDVLGILDQAEPLLKGATNSLVGAGLDMVGRGVGYATDGAKATSKLKVLQGALISKMPKMSGPQSDKDVQLYREMAGQIGDPTIPADQRLAAIEAVRVLNEKYAGQSQAASASRTQSARKSVLKGQVIDGYRFKGGDPSQQSNWEKQ